MASVLVVDDDVQLRKALTRDLQTLGYDVGAAGDYNEAIQRLHERKFDVLLTDLKLTDRDGMELITELPKQAPGTRPILMSAFASAKDSQRATELGAVTVLCKPFAMEELIRAVEQAVDCSTGFRGSVHGLSLVDILQMFHYGKRSVTLSMADSVCCQIHMKNGEVIHAERGDKIGEQALKSILTLPSGALKTSALETEQTTIERSFQSLLLDMLRELDEQGKKSETPQKRTSKFDSMFGFSLSESPPPATERIAPSLSPIDTACRTVVTSVEGAVAAGVVDLDTGILLGMYSVAGYPPEFNEAVAMATLDLFRGENVARIEQRVRAHRGLPEDGSHYFDEIQITSRNNLHFSKVMRGGKAAITLVTRRTTNLGLGWMQLKAVIPLVEPLVP